MSNGLGRTCESAIRRVYIIYHRCGRDARPASTCIYRVDEAMMDYSTAVRHIRHRFNDLSLPRYLVPYM